MRFVFSRWHRVTPHPVSLDHLLDLQGHGVDREGLGHHLHPRIEMLSAKLKDVSSAKPIGAPSKEAWQEIGRLLDRFSPVECAAYLRHLGMGQ